MFIVKSKRILAHKMGCFMKILNTFLLKTGGIGMDAEKGERMTSKRYFYQTVMVSYLKDKRVSQVTNEIIFISINQKHC